MGGTGPQRASDFPKKTPTGKQIAAKCAAIPPGLAKVVKAWPKLPKAIRRAILALIESA
jgi:hypothetical protein